MDSRRLSFILRNMNLNKKDIDNWEASYTQVPELAQSAMQEALRSYVRNYHEFFIKYLTMCNNCKLYNPKAKLSYLTVLNQHVSNGDIPENLVTFLSELQVLRNRFSHEYKRPSFEEVLTFYNGNKNNIEIMYNVIYKKYLETKKLEELSKPVRQMDFFS